MQRLIRKTKLARYMHGKFIRVEIFDPAALRNTDFRVREKLDICRRVDLNRRYQNVVDVFRFDTNASQRLERSLTFLADELATLAETTAPTFIQLGEISGWSSVDDRGLTVTADDHHPEVELHPIVPVTHPVDFRTHH